MNKINKLIDIAESNGWSVEVSENEYTFSQFSPAGKDFNITVVGLTVEEIIEQIKAQIDNFDCSEEAYLWLDNTGHGQNGAPYDMKDVYEDMEACETMIDELWEALVCELSGGDEENNED